MRVREWKDYEELEKVEREFKRKRKRLPQLHLLVGIRVRDKKFFHFYFLFEWNVFFAACEAHCDFLGTDDEIEVYVDGKGFLESIRK